MKMIFNDKKSKANQALLRHAENKLNRLDRYFRSDAEAVVKFNFERGQHIVEITVISAHTYFRAQNKSGDLAASFDSAIEAIERQILKNKTRLAKRLREGAFERTVSAEPDAFSEPVAEDEIAVVRTKRFSMKPMTAEEAILQMNLLNHRFYAFLNVEEDGRFSVVYTRDDGGYGLIVNE